MDGKVRLFECEDGFHYVAKSGYLVWLGHWDGSEQDEGTATYMSKEVALALAAELKWAAGGDPEPHVWEVYVNIVNDRKQSKFYKQISLHATKAGAEQKVEAEKKAWPEETSDPNFILAARKLRIGA